MSDIPAKFEQYFNIISSDSFQKKEGLGGEIPFFIAPYEAKKELEIREEIRLLKKKLSNIGLPVLELNLYDLVCEILDEKGMTDRMFRVEKRKSKEKFLRAIQSSLNIHEILMPKIADKISAADAKVNFLTGVGLVFPYIRSHTILNNLQSVATGVPTVTFFPGKYDGNSLNLFGLFKDDNYYRAFNLEQYT